MGPSRLIEQRLNLWSTCKSSTLMSSKNSGKTPRIHSIWPQTRWQQARKWSPAASSKSLAASSRSVAHTKNSRRRSQKSAQLKRVTSLRKRRNYAMQAPRNTSLKLIQRCARASRRITSLKSVDRGLSRIIESSASVAKIVHQYSNRLQQLWLSTKFSLLRNSKPSLA